MSSIHIKKSKRGSLHTALGISKDKKIPASELAVHKGDSPALKKKKVFAQNARKWHKGLFGEELPYPKPFVQGNVFATNSQEDSLAQNRSNFSALPADKQQQVLDELRSRDKKNQNKNPDNYVYGALGALSLIDALIPGDPIHRFTPTQPQETYNPHPYGTGSQAIMKDGGDLSPDKAKEMLRDGTAHGKKLTKKQKRYFGWIAGGGKAPEGTELPFDPNDPKYFKSDPLFNSYDTIQRLIGAGGNPLQNKSGSTFVSGAYETGMDLKDRQAIMDSIVIHNKANPNMSPEQRVSSFFETPSNNPLVQKWREKFKSYGYGPREVFNSSPNVDTQAIIANSRKGSPIAQLPVGGVISNGEEGINSYWGGDVEKISYNPYDGGVVEFKGASHANNGIGISYGGKNVEVEGGEAGIKDAEGNLHIMGNMYIPGTKSKFKSVAKKIAEKEQEYDKIKSIGSTIVNTLEPQNSFDKLKFNSGKVMMEGGDMGQRDLAKKKEDLTALQKAMLSTAQEFNLDTEKMSKGEYRKAKKGTWLKAPSGITLDGDPTPKNTVAMRHNNPGNIKYGPWAQAHGATPGEPASDGGRFAMFPDVQTGLNALRGLLSEKGYRNLPVNEAIKKWTGGTGYSSINTSEFRGKRVSDLNSQEFDKLVNVITLGEDGKYYSGNTTSNIPRNHPIYPIIPKGNVPPITLTDHPLHYTPPATNTPDVVEPPIYTLPPTNITERKIPSNVEGLSPIQYLPELNAFAHNQEEPVPVQKYMPDLYEPYQVSFQDRRNDAQSTYNAISRQLEGNPTALSGAAAQKYAADSGVGAEEFRTNQGISNEIINKNRELLNSAQMQNLQLADTQMVRQSQARSNTKAQNQEILNSLASKYLQNRSENQKLALYENLYNYRFKDTNNDGIPDKAVNYNPDASFNFGTSTIQPLGSEYNSTRTKADAFGNVKEITTMSPSEKKQQELDLKIELLKDKNSIVPSFKNIDRLGKGKFKR